jgi:hypothetical protein
MSRNLSPRTSNCSLLVLSAGMAAIGMPAVAQNIGASYKF